MEENVIDFPGETSIPIPAERILDAAKKAKLGYVLVLGWDENGDLIQFTNNSDPLESIYIMEKAKHWLLSDEE